MKSLKEHKVAFVVIGATAFPVHGYARATLDVDIFIRATNKNAINALAALKAFGYDVTDIKKEDLLKKKILIRQYTVETDIHPFVAGVTFDKVWKDKVKAKFGDTYAYFASLNDLLRMKLAAARPKDLEDVKYLKELKKNKHARF